MTDNDIKKALECCTQNVGCNGCPFVNSTEKKYRGGYACAEEMRKSALDLIKRQQAEIERLTINKNACALGMKRLAEQLEQAKSEAIKEFAERLNARIRKDIDEQGMLPLPYTKKAYDTVGVFIDNLVKEMTEVQG